MEKKKVFTIIYVVAVLCWLAIMIISGVSVWTGITWIIWLAVLACCTKSDIESRKIKNKSLLYGLSTTLAVILMQWIVLIINSKDIRQSTKMLATQLLSAFIAMMVWLVCMLLLSFITKHSIGYGDVKLFSALAFIMGLYDTLSIFVVSFILAGVAAFILLCKKQYKAKVPLAPFIMTGFYIFTLVRMGLLLYGSI